MKLEIIYDGLKSDRKEIDKIFSKLREFEKFGIKINYIDISTMPENEKYDLYSKKAVISSVLKKYKIRLIFGSHRKSGYYFGIKPAVIVYEDESGYPSDVYPHDKHGKIETIDEFLDKLRKKVMKTI
jgi:hypothetical protein